MTLYAESWPFICENPFGGSAFYTVHWPRRMMNGSA